MMIMKYIRTKDGRIIDVEKRYAEYLDQNRNRKNIYTKEELMGVLYRNLEPKQADTIEELCDEFVRIAGNNRHDTVSLELGKQYKIAYPNIKVYGAIWTDKGLIYVAKMNDKGELELI